MADLVRVLATLLAIAMFFLFAVTVVCQSRRRPGTVAAVLGILLAISIGAIAFAAVQGFHYRADLRKTEFASAAAQYGYRIGFTILILSGPAWPLIAIARIPNGPTTGPHGPQWVAVLFGYWLACFLFSAVLYSLVTGQVK